MIDLKLQKIVLLLLLFVTNSAWATVKLPAIFSNNMVLQRDLRVPVWGWADPAEQIQLVFKNKTYKATALATGKWTVMLDKYAAGGPYEMLIKGKGNRVVIKNILIGDVWVASGQSNMEYGMQTAARNGDNMKPADQKIRFFYVPMSKSLQPKQDIDPVPAASLNGKWIICSSAVMEQEWAWHGFSAIGYHFAADLRRTVKVPVGMIGTYKGGTPAQAWMSMTGLKKDTVFNQNVAKHNSLIANYENADKTYLQKKKEYQALLEKWNEKSGKVKLKMPTEPDGGFGAPANLFNAMVNPILHYGIKGVIWYQGESNGDQLKDAVAYSRIFPQLIKDWREQWGQGNFPFLWVQLANFRESAKTPSEGNWPWVREAQFKALSLPQTGMAVSIDVGDAADIHPKNKRDVGLRLALAAGNLVYKEQIVSSGPVYESMKISNGKIYLRFKSVGTGLRLDRSDASLLSKGNSEKVLKGFGIAAADGKFVWANASIQNDQVVVYNTGISNPVAVRYNWADNPEGNLYNMEGLPASPFRTDNWPAIATTSASAGIKEIRAHTRQLLLSDTAYATEQSYRLTDDIIYNTDAIGYFTSLTTEGSWKDIDYASQMRGAWRPSWHLYRAMLICRAYYKNHKPEYLSAVHKAMSFWIKNDFLCENWWQNNINTPFAYSSLILMLGDDVLPEELTFLNNTIVKRIPVHKATGQNLIWQLDNEARVALIKDDIEVFAEIMQRMQEVIDVTVKEGIQPDYSFHQHGPMLQFGNYGMHFTNSLLFWMTVTANTDVAFELAKQKMVFNYVSEGLRWSIYKKSMDITAVGRQIRTNSGLKRGENLAINSRMIRSFDKGKECEYFIDGYRDADQLQCKIEGNKSFWRSDYMIDRKQDKYMMSVKMHGPFVSRIESINTENLKGSFLNDGVTLLQRSGKEYLNIEALWNWAMLPGTTGDTTLNPAIKPAFSTANRGVFTGQVSNGQEGISAMDYDRVNVKARKSYFFVDGMMLALGAGIKAAEMKNIVTVVDQRFYTGNNALVSGKGNGGTRWLWTDSIAYFFPDPAVHFKTKVENRNANWINVDQASGDKPVSGTIFTAFIQHDHRNKYAYAVKPAIGLRETQRTELGKQFKILSNTYEVQAIETDQKMMAVFYKEGNVNLSDRTVLHVDQACLLIFQKKGKGNSLWLSDPTRKLVNVTITLNGRSKQFPLPAGDNLGGTTEVVF